MYLIVNCILVSSSIDIHLLKIFFLKLIITNNHQYISCSDMLTLKTSYEDLAHFLEPSHCVIPQ